MGLETTLYSKSPLWLQNVLTSTRGLDFRLRRASTARIRRQLRFLVESQWWSESQFREYQALQLRAVLAPAFERVPYYRSLRVLGTAGKFRLPSLEDLSGLPILEKSDVRGREEEFLDLSVRGRRVGIETSGTTGSPMRVFETRDSFSRRWGFVARLRHWAGVMEPLYPRRVQFTGRSIVPINGSGSGVYWRYNVPGNALLMSTVHISHATVPAYVSAMRRFSPDLIEGYPSAILVVARLALAQGLRLPRPRAIITSAETLLPHHRAELEAAFGCRIHDQYAASEPSCFWGECEHGSLHVNPEYGISEIVDSDGRSVAPGEEGSVVVTSFLNSLMPLIRYRVGDLAVRGCEEPCPCGRRMPRVERVLGRIDDILYVPERGYVGRLDPVFKGLRHVVEAQIIQESLRLIRVVLVPSAGYGHDVERRFHHNLREKLGSEVEIRIERVDSIPRGANGKFRSVVSRVKHLYPDRL